MSNLIIKRPENIFELFSSLLNINGVGEKKLRLLEKKIGPYIINLLFYLPIKSINRFKNTSLKNINHGEIITCEVEVIEINMQPYKFRNKNNISRIITFGLDEEKSIRLDIIYFGKNTQYLKNIYKVGNKIIISGKFESFNGLGQIVHPDYVLTDNQRSQIPKIEPVYPLFLGVNQKFIYKIINQSIKKIPNIPEWLSDKVLEKYKFSNWQDSITKLHNPENIADAELNSIYRRRLAFDELVANQISMLLIKNKISKINRNLPSKNNSQIIEKFYKSLPFKLTKNQIEVVNEIKEDIHDEKTMVRMLQGDVGSGKTIVALISMLHAISDGSQSVLLVPTEILALQHYNTVKNLLTPINIEVVLLLGESRSIHSKKERMEIINNIAEGNVKVIIGTHALISKKVTYKNLSLAVIDEQHRFGVKQRYEITQKSTNVNILVMTATPIPRSLALTAYGDMDISIINEKPRGRQPIKTYVLPQSKINEVLLSMERAIKNGALIYWVCPLIEESKKIDLIAVNERFDFLVNYFPNIDISYSYLNTEVIAGVIKSNVSGTAGSDISIKGNKLPYAPKHTLMLGVHYNVSDNFSLRFDTKHVSKVFTDFENILETDENGVTGPVPEYTIFNLSVSYGVTEDMRLYLSGKNMTDLSYIGSRLHSNPGQPQPDLSSGILIGPRRQINLGLEYNF